MCAEIDNIWVLSRTTDRSFSITHRTKNIHQANVPEVVTSSLAINMRWNVVCNTEEAE